jgi:hypothetical protein
VFHGLTTIFSRDFRRGILVIQGGARLRRMRFLGAKNGHLYLSENKGSSAKAHCNHK